MARIFSVTSLLLALLLSSCQSTPKPPTLTAEHQELAARARAFIEAHGETTTPAREYVNFLRMPRMQRWITQLAGEQPLDKQAAGWGARSIEQTIAHADAGLQWPAMPKLSIPYLQKAPTFDGKIGPDEWAGAYRSQEIWKFNSTEPGGPPSTFYLAWDEQYLYVGYDFVDTDLQAEDRERDGHIYNDDCAEIMILPSFRHRSYWELIVSPAGSIYDSIQCKNMDTWGSNQDTSQSIEGMLLGIDVRGTINDPTDTDEGFSVEVGIPWDQLAPYMHGPPQPGHTLHLILVRLDRNHPEKNITPYAFQPLVAWGHNIWNHVPVELVK